jgi:uncharacterized membrane protein YphA (DoxX/SURF4 family)
VSDPFVLLGACAGIVCLVAYVIITRSRSQDPNLVDGLSLILSGVGLLTGFKVCWFAYIYSDTAPLKEISIQIFIGGVAIAWVAIANGIKKFRS